MTIASRLYDNAERVWREMYAQAVPVAALSGPDAYLRDYCPAGTLGVYVGALTRLFQGLGLKSAQQYHHCKLCLIQMGTIAQLRRGSAHRLSAWVLLAEPTPELYDTRTGPGVANGRRRRDSTPMVPATEVLQPDGLASFLAKSPAGRVEELRAMTSAAS